MSITKGEYQSYDTFMRAEAVQYLRQYLEARRPGRLDPPIQPETITDESPLIRDMLWDRTRGSDKPNPIGPKQVYELVHSLFVKTGLIRLGDRHYTLRVHTFRKFFKTNLVAAGVPESHADSFIGHVTDLYNPRLIQPSRRPRSREPQRELRQGTTMHSSTVATEPDQDTDQSDPGSQGGPEQVPHRCSSQRTPQSQRHNRET